MFAYQDMAYIWSDPADSRTCGLVFRRSSDEHFWYEFHGYKLERGVSSLFSGYTYIYMYILPLISSTAHSARRCSFFTLFGLIHASYD